MSRKLALLIGNSDYDDTTLSQLSMPAADVQGLAEALQLNGESGFDDVATLINRGRYEAAEAIESFFRQGRADDLLMLYFSGHGLKNEIDGRLFLAVKDTKNDRLRATGINASFITELMDECFARQQILILDCCYGGAFSTGFKGAAPVGQNVGGKETFQGTGVGRVVLTASDATNYAWEGDRIIGGAENSLFTHYLINGLRTGAADLNGDGHVSVDEWYEYAREKISQDTPKQKPQMWTYKAEGKIRIASVPRDALRAAPLPLQVQELIGSQFTEVRLAAVSELAKLLQGAHRGLALAASAALNELTEDDSRRVSKAAADVLAGNPPVPAPKTPLSGPTDRPPVRAETPSPPPPQSVHPVERGGTVSAVGRPEYAVLRGVNRLAGTIAVTLGPKGRSVALQTKTAGPKLTTDSLLISSELQLTEPLEEIGAQMIRDVVKVARASAGDGSTTAAIIAQSIFAEGVKAIVAGANPMALQSGAEQAVQQVVGELKRLATAVNDESLKSVITTSSGDQFVAALVCEAYTKVGKDGTITVEESTSTDTSIEVVEGMKFLRGYLSPYFITDPIRSECVLEHAYVLMFERKISALKQMLPLLEKVAKEGRPLLLISEDIDGEALKTMVVNKMRDTLKCCAVKAPGFGDRRKAMLADIATLTGGTDFDADSGVSLESVELSDLGRARRIVVNAEETILIECAGDRSAIENRAKQIKKQLDETTSDYDREKLQERLANIVTGVAVILVGAPKEAAIKEAAARIESGLLVARAAIDEGVVPGGGAALLRAGKVLGKAPASGDERLGMEIIKNACAAPARHILAGAAVDVEATMASLLKGKGGEGFNVVTGKPENLLKAGIIDPVRTVRVAFESAAALSLRLLTSAVAASHSG